MLPLRLAVRRLAWALRRLPTPSTCSALLQQAVQEVHPEEECSEVCRCPRLSRWPRCSRCSEEEGVEDWVDWEDLEVSEEEEEHFPHRPTLDLRTRGLLYVPFLFRSCVLARRLGFRTR